MKTSSLKQTIQWCMLASALAIPAAFAQDNTPAPMQPTAPMHEGSVKDPTPTAAPNPAATDTKPMSWKDLDVNKDGKVSKDEAAADATLATDFDSADSDKNGALSKAEFKKYEAGMKKQVSMQDGKK